MAIKTVALTSATLMALAVPAFAGNLSAPVIEQPVAAPAPAPARLDGDWTGVYGGLQYGGGDVVTDGTNDLDGQGGLGGAHLGYDYDFGQFVLGGAVEYDAGEIKLDSADTLESITRLKARAGLDLGNGLAYLTGGAARATAENLGTSDGGFYGLGYEHKVTDNVTLGAEVLEHTFTDFNDTNTDLDATTAQLRASYRF